MAGENPTAVVEQDASELRAAKEKELNASRSGKGTRVRIGMTRGRNPQEIQYEAFDESQPETLPVSITEFAELTKAADEKQLVAYLIDGFNSASYTAASDPVAEFVDPSWTDEAQKQFRIVVRNYSAATKLSIEETVNLVKPGFSKAQEAAKKQ